MIGVAAAAEPSAPSPLRAQVHVLDGHRVALDVYPAAGPPRGAAILSHGFTRSRRTLAGHAQTLADAGVLAVTPDLPCTFDFLCNARAFAARAGPLRAPPSRCNAEAVAAPWGSVLPALWRDEVIEGASPCDFELPTDWMSRLACGNNALARQQQVRQGLLTPRHAGCAEPATGGIAGPRVNCQHLGEGRLCS